MKNVSKSTTDVAFARGLAMSELGSTGATWRPAITMTAPIQASTHAPVPNTYAAAAPLSAFAALPTVKTNVAAMTVKQSPKQSPKQSMHDLVKTNAGRDNRTTEGPSSRRVPV